MNPYVTGCPKKVRKEGDTAAEPTTELAFIDDDSSLESASIEKNPAQKVVNTNENLWQDLS